MENREVLVKNFTSQNQRDEFKALIYNHVIAELPQDEWRLLRGRALDQLAGVHPYPMINSDEGAEQLIQNNVLEDGGEDIEAIIEAIGAPVTEIGSIEGSPVFYLEGTGIYLWDPKGQTGHYLSFWITFPAYPPGW